MNVRALEAALIMAGIRVPELCQAIGISESAFYRKKAGITEFTQGEISAIAKVCRMTPDTMLSIFFADQVSETTQDGDQE